MTRLMMALMVCGCFLLAACTCDRCGCEGECEGECGASRTCAQEEPAAGATHVIAHETNYYMSGPQQARPPEGSFAAGTKVTLISGAGSYSLVRSPDGIEAYVSTDALKALD